MNTDHIKYRNMLMQVLLFIVTLGIYAIYWFYVSAREMVDYRKLDGDPGLWTVMFPLPLLNFYAAWRHAGAVEALTDGRYGRLPVFLAWVVFPPIAWFVTQTELNARATE